MPVGVVGNRIKCYGFCPGVGKVKESRRSIRAHASQSFSQWADEPRAGRSVVEVSCCTGWGAVEAPRRADFVRVGAGARSRHPVERASYESEPEHGRGAPSSGLHTSRSRSAAEAPRRVGLVRGGLNTRSRRAAFYCGFSRFSDGCGYPRTVGTDTRIKSENPMLN
jgi:hypothetical protein